MPFVLPPGYRAVPVSQVTGFDQLSTFSALEENQPEGSRMLCALTFWEKPSPEVVAVINQKCWEQGVSPWPELQDIAFADPYEPVVYICWQKGAAWWGWILVLLASIVLPPLIMAGLWLILPESLRQMVEAVMYVGIVGIVMLVMSKMTKSIVEAK